MSVKSPIVRCFSNAAVKVPRNYRERTLNIALTMYFWNGTLHKQRLKLFLSNCSLIPLFLNNITKMKTKILWHLHTIQKSPLLKKGEFRFSLVWLMELSIILSQVKSFSDFISSLAVLVDVQRLDKNGKLMLCF